VQFEDEVLGEVSLVTPNDPANSNIGESKFMATGVDGDDAR